MLWNTNRIICDECMEQSGIKLPVFKFFVYCDRDVKRQKGQGWTDDHHMSEQIIVNFKN